MKFEYLMKVPNWYNPLVHCGSLLPAPTDVFVQTHDLDYFTVSWTAPIVLADDIVGYIIQYNVAEIPEQGLVLDPTQTTITFQNVDLNGGEPQDVLLVPYTTSGINPSDIVQAQAPTQAGIIYIFLKKIELIMHSIYGVNKFNSLRSEFQSILTPVEWKIHYSMRGISSGSLDMHSTTQGVTSVTKRVKIHSNSF